MNSINPIEIIKTREKYWNKKSNIRRGSERGHVMGEKGTYGAIII